MKDLLGSDTANELITSVDILLALLIVFVVEARLAMAIASAELIFRTHSL